MAITGRVSGDPAGGIATLVRVTTSGAGITVPAYMRPAMAYTWGQLASITGIIVPTAITIAATIKFGAV